MPGLKQAVICVIAFIFCTTMTQGQGEIPVKISPVVIPVPDTSGECPSDKNLAASYEFKHSYQSNLTNLWTWKLEKSVLLEC